MHRECQLSGHAVSELTPGSEMNKGPMSSCCCRLLTCSPLPGAQSGSGGAEAVGGWEADLGGMGNAFGGMQLSNSAGIVRSPLHA